MRQTDVDVAALAVAVSELPAQFRTKQELPDGTCLPVGLDAVAEALVQVPRRVTAAGRKERRAHGRLVGRMFEAYVADLLAVVAHRHHVIGGRRIDRAVPKGDRRADAFVLDPYTAVAVEVSLQPVDSAVGRGRSEALDAYCARIGEKVSQARCSLQHLPRVCRRDGVPVPQGQTFVVVTDRPLPHTPALAAAMRQALPKLTHHRIVIGIEELEMLVALTGRGWSLPSLVSGWQAKPVDVSLRQHLSEMVRWTGASPAWRDDGMRRLLEDPRPEDPAA